MNPVLALGLAACILLCWLGHNTESGNEKLILKCGGTVAHDRVLTAKWDGGTLVAVKCNNGRSFTR